MVFFKLSNGTPTLESDRSVIRIGSSGTYHAQLYVVSWKSTNLRDGHQFFCNCSAFESLGQSCLNSQPARLSTISITE